MKPVQKRECLWCSKEFPVERRRGRPQKYCCRSHRQRAYEYRVNMGIGTIADRDRMLKDAGGICYICYEPISDGEWEVDHVIPTLLGGPTVQWNLKPVHPRCNREKAAKMRYVVMPIIGE